MSTPKEIKTEADHDKALARIEELMDMDPSADSDEADELEALATLAEKYEEEHFPFDPPDPISAIEFRLDQMDMKPADLEPYIGPPDLVAEIMSGQQPLTEKMIQSLNQGLGIPLESLTSDKAPVIKMNQDKKFKPQIARDLDEAIADCRAGRNMAGPFKTVDELMAALEKDDD